LTGAALGDPGLERMPDTPPAATGPLAGLKVLDLSRVLAGPWATQILGDLGADIIKIEQPGQGDDTRRWGPPFLADGSGDAAYFVCANRNKRSAAINMADPRGAEVIRGMARQADIVVENFKVGGLRKYGLDYASMAAENPKLIYCSITGFGQSGPYKDRGGYDFLIQGMSGLMSVTGVADGEPGAGPMKVGVPVSDLFAGLYAATSILAALNHVRATGLGQHIDCALLDTQVALLANQASNYLNGGGPPRRFGNAHPNVVPYQNFVTADGSEILVALGNDRQFRAFCELIGRPELAADARFADNSGRSVNRKLLQAELGGAICRWLPNDLLAAMDAKGLPGGKVNSIPEILADPQIAARGLVRTLLRPDGTEVKLLGFPEIFSTTPANYRHAPPRMGADTVAVLREAGYSEAAIAAYLTAGVAAMAS